MLLDKNFEVEFAKVYPNFTKKLILLNEQLTFTEVKICMYIKMNFSNKQILDLMHISESTLSNLRSSIRKKLNLDRKKGLFTTIIKL
ncbi:MAG: helix-turn-helix transcriptional regulator [Flavobacteriaceae bacterium]